jgi:hypothetical protein
MSTAAKRVGKTSRASPKFELQLLQMSKLPPLTKDLVAQNDSLFKLVPKLMRKLRANNRHRNFPQQPYLQVKAASKNRVLFPSSARFSKVGLPHSLWGIQSSG